HQRGFYPMVAAQRFGEVYELKIVEAPQNVDSALTQGPEMASVRELMYWNLDNCARSACANLLKSKSKSVQAQLARYA
ncbi:murein transglycosylase, partial [Escherichia coli]